MLKSSGKACKINGFTVEYGIYYTSITPFFEKNLEMTNIKSKGLRKAVLFWRKIPKGRLLKIIRITMKGCLTLHSEKALQRLLFMVEPCKRGVEIY